MSVSGIELITRTSLTFGHARISEYLKESFNPRPTDDRNWSWFYLRSQFREKNLEELYMHYQQRLQTGFFSVFLGLQMILSVIHIGVLLATSPEGKFKEILPDIGVYIAVIALFWPMVIIVFKERLIRDYPWLPLLVSCIAVTALVIADLGLPLYHIGYSLTEKIIRPAYATHTLLAIYVFLPITQNIQAVILGVTVTACHMVLLGTIVYEHMDDMYRRLAADFIFLFCLNGLGLYYRYMNEVTVRRTFLDRRACVESTIKLRYEKQQEDHLMLSILPRHIVDVVKADIRNIFQYIQKSNSTPLRKKPFSDMYVKEHHNVTILYADVVNYSKLTVSLPVNKLVETLNELFGRFDEASEEHDVLRIKFLGDCYYCVAGVPESNPNHAKNCVDLGLAMIAIIKKVREERKLRQGLDMRIGVHSGNILSGLLGVCKWQYDIWSNDVIIANHMEQAGKPGKVHITKQTLDLLGGKYEYYPGYGADRNQLLAKYNIETFFIGSRDKQIRSSEDSFTEDQSQTSHFVPHAPRRISTAIPGRKNTNKPQVGLSARRMTNETNGVGWRRHTVFMNNNLFRYQQTLKIADIIMGKAIKKMRYGIHQRWIRNEGIAPLCLTFKDLKWELPYLKQPDPLFKFYVSSACIVLLCMLGIQGVNMPRSHWVAWTAITTACISTLLFLPFLWTFFLWNNQNSQDDDYQILKPSNKFVKMLYEKSQYVVSSTPARTIAYLVVCILLGASSMLELVECGTDNISNATDMTPLAYLKDTQSYKCVPPWQLSQTCALAVLMSFFFLKIHFQLKLLIGFIFIGVFTVCVLIARPNVFNNGETWNPHVAPEIAHIMNIVFLLLTLHLLDRQSEYMMRLDYQWKRQLLIEQEDATFTRAVNQMLLENILPVHVAELYLNTNRAHDELYHEEYDSVAVMFASLTEYNLDDDEDTNEKLSLTLLNQIICDFDKLLFKDSARRIEKIKVAGWTYMAACGLVIGRRDSNTLQVNFSENTVVVLVKFAAKMMKVLEKFNRETLQSFNLRVGISHGPVTAGVVGSQKPLYDIWGDAVNMASRMDSTGEPGKVQVTPNTALVLSNEGIQCINRGETFVKGKGIVKTSFVAIDDKFKLVKLQENEKVFIEDDSSYDDNVIPMQEKVEVIQEEDEESFHELETLETAESVKNEEQLLQSDEEEEMGTKM